LPRARYLTPVVADRGHFDHLAAACELASRNGGEVVALVIGLVPHSLPMGSDVPQLWSRLEYEAARCRRLGRELGQEVETVLVLSDSAGEALVQLAEECEASSVCLSYQPGLLAELRRWRDPLWRSVLEESPCPVVLVRFRPAEQAATQTAPLPARALVPER
jgi:nucleotide-binding universal stress UspA family protein